VPAVRTIWAWGVAGAGLALALAAVALETQTGTGVFATGNGPPNLVFAAAFGPIGALIVSRQRGNRLGPIFLLVGVDGGVTLFAYEYARYASVTHPGLLPYAVAVGWLSGWVWTLGFSVLATFGILLYPDGRLPSSRWWPAAVVGAAAIACQAVSQMLAPGPMVNETVAANPLGVPALAEALRTMGHVGQILVVAGLVLGVAAMAARWWSHPRGSRERGQISMVVIATAIVMLQLLLPGSDDRLSTVVTGSLVFALIPAAIGYAVVRRGLYDLDIAVNRSLVYGTLAVVLAFGYASVLALTGLATGQRQTPGEVLAVALVGVGVLPLRGWLQHTVNRLMFGDRGDPYAAVSRLSATLHSAVAPGGSLNAVVDAIAHSLKLAYVAVETDGDVKAAVGQPTRKPVRIPMTHQGTPVGTLIAEGPPGRAIGARDRALLADLARHAGVAVYAAGLADDLQTSRHRLVEAREDERRRLRRDLHDGLGPGLASVVLGLDLAAGLLDTDPQAARAALKELKAETVTSVEEIRRLVYDLRPPALDDLGLVGAIRQQADRIGRRHPTMSITVRAPASLPVLPAATEVAAYRIITEAITNAARHAAATTCDVCVSLDGQLHLDVADDGLGVTLPITLGVGLSAMRERVAELGGSWTIGPGPDRTGTRIATTLPLEAP
jgi:two-component system, NarL family, sensor kinase